MKANWHYVEEIFLSALEEPRDRRTSYLQMACADDVSLREAVEEMLRSHERAGDFLEKPAFRFDTEMPGNLAAGGKLSSGELLGNYRILSLLGEGGMGEVYLAQDTALGRDVAIKLVKRGFGTSDFIRHFRHEERILAALNHPHIARLYGGAVTPGGLPYFVMEYVEGDRLDRYSEERGLTINQRLVLFRKICAAVSYAHQNLIIHRDLKPANIRVTLAGEPKLLDFGIAKLLDPERTQSGGQTMTLQGVMTPEYASPEQTRGEIMTTASDIYSLGVVLYELLTGEKPYKIDNHSPAEIARAISETEPQRPSRVATQRRNDSQPTTHNPRLLRGDLDNIVLMAMRKEPARRYLSVAQLSEDIRRHLEGLPVIARKDTVTYRTAKFIGRNKIGVAAVAVVFLTLISGIVATTWEAKKALANARVAAEQRDLAQKQAAKADRVTAFLQNVLGFSDPSWASSNPNRKRDATISEALIEAARRADKELANEPEALAAVHLTIGNTYRTQSRYPEAEPHLRAALEIRRRVLGPDNPETGQSMVNMGEWCVLTGGYIEAEPLFREAISIFRSMHDAKWLAITLNDLGTLKWFNGEHVAAEKFLHEALDASADFVGAERAPRAIMYNTLGLARRDQGDLDQGAEFLQKAITEHRALSGEPRPELALSLSNLASILLLQGEYDRAESLSQEAFQLFQKTVGENHQYSAYPLLTLAEIYYRQANYSKAREAVEHAMQIQQRALPREHIDLVRARITLGKIMMRSGSLNEAESTLRSALERLVTLLPQRHAAIAAGRGVLGECLILQKRYAEAEPLLLESQNAFHTALGPKDPRTRDACRRLVILYEAWGKPKNAERFGTL